MQFPQNWLSDASETEYTQLICFILGVLSCFLFYQQDLPGLLFGECQLVEHPDHYWLAQTLKTVAGFGCCF